MNKIEVNTKVYNELMSGTMEGARLRAEISALDAQINSGKYSANVIKELRDKKRELSVELRRNTEGAIRKAGEHVKKYQSEAEAFVLDPTELTDDCKLLKAGIKLNQRDLEGILDRTSGNRTMHQLVIRYAKENGIGIDAKYNLNDSEVESTARCLNVVTNLYSRWIDTPKARVMLDRFFNESGIEHNSESEGGDE